MRAIGSIGVGDVTRLGAALGKDEEAARPFIAAVLQRLLEAVEKAPVAPSAATTLPQSALARSFWGVPPADETQPAPETKGEDPVPGDGLPPSGEATEAAPKAEYPFAMDAKFEEGLQRNAVSTLQRLLWMRALDQLRLPTGPAEADAAMAVDGSAHSGALQLPPSMEKFLGGGKVSTKSGSGSLPAEWWKAEQDRALLEHTATHGLSLTEATWEEQLLPKGVFCPAAADAARVGVKQVIVRRDALLRRLQDVHFGKPGCRRRRCARASSAALPPAAAARHPR